MHEFDFAALTAHVRYNLIIGLVTPRPIALVTSMDSTGRVNAAPYSAFSYAGVDPVLVTIGAGNRPEAKEAPSGMPVPKDTVQNIRASGEFVINIVSEGLAEAMNICAIDFPPDVSELQEAGLTTVLSTRVKVPRIAEAPASLECREVTTIEVGHSRVIVGEVLCAHVGEEYIDPAGPYIRADLIHSIGRMNGGGNYVRTRGAIFSLARIPYKEWREKRQPG